MSSQLELKNLRADMADLEGGVQSLTRRIEAAQAYLARARSADREIPHVLTEREQLEQERQRAAYDLVVSGKGERRLREAEARIADFERREELARLAERERQRLAAEEQRARAAEARQRLEEQYQAAIAARDRAYGDMGRALDALAVAAEAALAADATRHNIAIQLGRVTLMGEARDRLRGRVSGRLAEVGADVGLRFGSFELPGLRDREPLALVEQTDEPDDDLPPAA